MNGGAEPSARSGAVHSQDEHARQVENWLWLLLRFAITRDPKDELAVVMTAASMDSTGRQWGGSAPTFFRRSSAEVCEAITALNDRAREAVLKRHVSRIADPRLKQAFQRAVFSDPPPSSKRPRADLWNALPCQRQVETEGEAD